MFERVDRHQSVATVALSSTQRTGETNDIASRDSATHIAFVVCVVRPKIPVELRFVQFFKVRHVRDSLPAAENTSAAVPRTAVLFIQVLGEASLTRSGKVGSYLAA